MLKCLPSTYEVSGSIPGTTDTTEIHPRQPSDCRGKARNQDVFGTRVLDEAWQGPFKKTMFVMESKRDELIR